MVVDYFVIWKNTQTIDSDAKRQVLKPASEKNIWAL